MVVTVGQEPGNKGTCTSRVSIVITRTNTCRYLICVKHYFEHFIYGNHHNSFELDNIINLSNINFHNIKFLYFINKAIKYDNHFGVELLATQYLYYKMSVSLTLDCELLNDKNHNLYPQVFLTYRIYNKHKQKRTHLPLW